MTYPRPVINELLQKSDRYLAKSDLGLALDKVTEALDSLEGIEPAELSIKLLEYYERIKAQRLALLRHAQGYRITLERAQQIEGSEGLAEAKDEIKNALEALETLGEDRLQDLVGESLQKLKHSLYGQQQSQVGELIRGKNYREAAKVLEEIREYWPDDAFEQACDELVDAARQEADGILAKRPRDISLSDHQLIDQSIGVISSSSTDATDLKEKWSDLRRKAEKARVRRLKRRLKTVHESICQERFGDAEKALDRARTCAYRDAEVAKVVSLSEEIRIRREVGVRILISVLSSLLAQRADKLADLDIERGEISLARLQSIGAPPLEIRIWQEQWERLQKRRQVLNQAEQLKARVEGISQAPCFILSRYEEAIDQIRCLAARAAEFADIDRWIQSLQKNAEQRYDEARQEEHRLVAQAVAGNFGPLIGKLKSLQKLCDRLPRYKWGRDDTRGENLLQQQGDLPAQQAVEWLQSLAQVKSDEQADVLLSKAEGLYLDNPIAAQDQLALALDLPHISEQKRSQLEEFRDKELTVALGEALRIDHSS